MTDQLLLIERSAAWRLDRTTRERGRRGVAAARAILRASKARAHAEQCGADAPVPDDASLPSAA